MIKKIVNESATIYFYLVVTSNSTKPEQPPQVMPGYGDNFTQIIGKIIAQWAVLEQEIEVLLTALLIRRKVNHTGWIKMPFNRRWTLLIDEWNIFSAASAGLTEEMRSIQLDVDAGKVIRDSIAHKRLMMGIEENEPLIRFHNESQHHPWSKSYFHADFESILLKIVLATGKLFRLTNLNHAKHFAPQDILLLQQLPNMSYLRFPMPATGKPRPKSFSPK